jgi:5-methylcytosine-specific restriction endonuclease McrA
MAAEDRKHTLDCRRPPRAGNASSDVPGTAVRSDTPGICTDLATVIGDVKALGLGGTDSDDNSQVACAPCHRRKTSLEGHRAHGHHA